MGFSKIFLQGSMMIINCTQLYSLLHIPYFSLHIVTHARPRLPSLFRISIKTMYSNIFIQINPDILQVRYFTISYCYLEYSRSALDDKNNRLGHRSEGSKTIIYVVVLLLFRTFKNVFGYRELPEKYKYHRGIRTDMITPAKTVRMSLTVITI